jgi:DNA replication protein DnaC
VLIVLLSMAGIIGAQAADKFPPFWRKAMTNDPKTNYFLKKYSAPLDDPAGTAVRNIMLARVVGAECQASRINRARVKAYRDRMIGPLTPEQLKEAAFQGGSALRRFNYQDLAHLCAGIDYQFGQKGVLIPGAVSTGKGEPAHPYDPRNPYFRLPEFTGG